MYLYITCISVWNVYMYIMITTISTHLIVSIYQRILGKTSTSIFNIVTLEMFP